MFYFTINNVNKPIAIPKKYCIEII